MKFFELTHPSYISDQAQRRHNPVKVLHNISVPAIVCDDCGCWGGSYRIRKDIYLTSKAKEILNKKSIYLSDWNEAIAALANEIGIQPSLLRPATELGMPNSEIANSNLNDFTHPFPGQVWIKEDVMDSLLKIQVSGIEFCKVNTVLKNSERNAGERPPQLWELIVKGKAWRRGNTLDKIQVCTKCKRTIFPDPDWIQVDEETWDGTDFFNVDMNPNIILVTEKICKLFSEKGYTNFLCKEVY